MHVALIRPPQVTSQSAPQTHPGVPPLALAALGAVLEQAGHRVTAVDAFGENPHHIAAVANTNLVAVGLDAAAIAARVPPDVGFVGVSCMFSQEWIYAKQVIAAVRRAVPRAVIVLGGEHATADPEHALRSAPELDACALGEGEATVLELAAAVAAGGALCDVAGLVVRDAAGGAMYTAARARIEDLDALPWPAWHLVPLHVYLDNHFGFEEYNRRAMPILATRGCPYQCTFCSNPTMWTTRWLARDPADVVREIRHYVQAYRAEHIEFYDLTAVVDRRWILRFCELLRAEHPTITWRLPSGTRSEALDAEVLAAMAASGCVAVVYAPESGSPRTLVRIKKKVQPARMLRSMRAAVRSGMHTRAHFIMGMPGQTPSEIGETFAFIAKCAWVGVHDISSFFFYPYPGSEMYRDLVQAGKIDPRSPDYDELLAGACFTDMRFVRSWSEYFPPAALRLFCLASMGMFYALSLLLRPQRIVQAVWRVLRGRPFTWLERFLHAEIRQIVRGGSAPAAGTARPLAGVAPPAPSVVAAARPY